MVHEFVITIHWFVEIVIHKYPDEMLLMVHYHRNQVHVDNNLSVVMLVFSVPMINRRKEMINECFSILMTQHRP